MTAGMSSKKSDYPDWLISCGAKVAVFMSVMAMISLILIYWMLWSYSSSALVAIVVSFTFTHLPIQLINLVSNLWAILANALDDLTLETKFSSAVRTVTLWCFQLHGKIMHGHEIHGMENLPETTGGLIVYPHLLNIHDMFYLMAAYNYETGKVLGGVIHRGIPDLYPAYCKILDFVPQKEQLVERLNQGRICTVSPGGSFEACFGDNHDVLWNDRTGFAAVAKKCGVPIIPMFTANGHEAMPFRIPVLRDFFLEVYARTKRFPFLPVLELPVKMRTYLGKPLFCGADESPAEFAERVKAGICELRDKHQRKSRSILLAFLERFSWRPAMLECRDGKQH